MEPVVNNIQGTQIRPSTIHGMGLFATSDLDAGLLLCTLDGQIVEWDLYKQNPSVLEWNSLDGVRLLLRPVRTKYSYINHSRVPNCEVVGLSGDRVCVRTTRAIKTSEELLLDYRKETLPAEYLSGHGATYL